MSIIMLLAYLVVLVIGFSFAMWVVNNYCPEPFKKYAILVLAFVAVIIVIVIILNLAGITSFSLPLHR